MSAKKFNTKYIHKDYDEDFLYNLFIEQNINYKDKENKILIKVK